MGLLGLGGGMVERLESGVVGGEKGIEGRGGCCHTWDLVWKGCEVYG